MRIESSGDQGVPDKYMKPRLMLRELEKVIQEMDDVVLGTDIGNISAVANGYVNFKKPRSFLAPMTFGNCGYSLPAVMGAKVAAP